MQNTKRKTTKSNVQKNKSSSGFNIDNKNIVKRKKASNKSGCLFPLIIGFVVFAGLALIGIIIVVKSRYSKNTVNLVENKVSHEVNSYTETIEKYAEEFGIPEYTALIKAIMMQESGGRGNDPMQASECSFNKDYPQEPNGITDTNYSIKVGVENIAAHLKEANVKNPIDIPNINVAIQAYNFGNGYVHWVKEHYGAYSLENAKEFSEIMKTKTGMSGYGDIEYVPHVLRYYPFKSASELNEKEALVEMAKTQVGERGGKPYWSWYGFSEHVQWCACFVSFCADKLGMIENGTIPKFSYCGDGVNWFYERGRFKDSDSDYVPKTGDIVFFDLRGDGELNHVGIVEKCENNTVYTIEGNSDDVCRQLSYKLTDKKLYGYGSLE